MDIGRIKSQEITEEMQNSYLDYAMSVIVGRALPDIRDGLKPVHRRILYTMWEEGLRSHAKFRKSATVVGSCLGRYHPHGDIAVYDSLARLAQDFSMRYPLVNGQGNFGCFTKDIKVKLTDGRNLSFEELILESQAGKKNYTYTINALGFIAIAEIKNPRLTRKNAEIIEVTLDNGEEIKCTPNHLFMLRDGTYKEAEKLKPGDSLMPLYQKFSEKTDRLNREGYVLIYQNKKNEWVPAHHLADNYNLSAGRYARSAGRVRHHADFNRLNNDPNNIIRMQWGEHWQAHYKQAARMHRNSEYRKKIAEGRNAFWSNPDNKARYSKSLSERNIQNWKDPEYQKKMRQFLSEVNKQYILSHPERREELGRQATKTLKRLWQDPKYRSWMHEKIIKGNKNHISNKTGKLKFLNICQEVIKQHAIFNEKNYLKIRNKIYPYGSAPLWKTGLNKYFQNDPDLIRQEINHNHKVVKTERISKPEDVYDLTIDNTHNFCLAAGVFVHNSLDGDAPAAMRYCVTGDTLILTEKGLTPIKGISSNGSENIKIEILSKDRNINVATKWFDSGEHPTIKITTQSGLSLKGSRNHPILIWSKDINEAPGFRWRLFSQLKPGDVAVIDRTPDLLWPKNEVPLKDYWPDHAVRRTEKKKLPEKLDENLAFILGALISEGTIKHNEIEFCNGDAKFIEYFEKYWVSVFPDCRLHRFLRRSNSFGKKPYHTIEIHSRFVVEFLRNIGLAEVKSAFKIIPALILQSPKPVAAAFLQACFEGDGSISFSGKMTELSYISVSEDLIKQMQIILLRFGIASAKRFDKWRHTHKLYIRGLTHYTVFREQIGFAFNSKKEKLNKAIARLHKNYSQSDFVPYLSELVRSSFDRDSDYQFREFALKHNFDRYPKMEQNYGRVLMAVKPSSRTLIHTIFEDLLSNNYLFDPISKVEVCGKEKVYSLRVDSACHSFIGNGFINHNTECRLTPLAEEMLQDIEKETVDWADNYDGTRQEPQVLPAKVPQLLLNGSVGIAVGMATNIPPHNLGELVDAIIFLIANPRATSDDLMKIIKGPDFPTGGAIYDRQAILQVYSTGKGAVVTRAIAEIGDDKKGVRQIIVSEIPYQVNKATLLETIAEFIKDKKIDGIRDIRDESNKDGVRIVIDLKNDAYPQKVLNRLYKLTDLQKPFHLNMLALTENGLQPQVLSIKGFLEQYVEHRYKVITRRSQFDLARAKERAHILEGLKKALDHIDAVIATIKKSATKEIAHAALCQKFKLSEAQATAILEMKLQTLAGLERQKIEDELKEKKRLAEELEALLKSPKKILEIIKSDLLYLKEKYGDERRTKIFASPVGEFKEEDLIPEEECIITLTQGGYIKRLNPKNYRAQHRGGKGVAGITTREEDYVGYLACVNTHDNLLFFTSSGRVFQAKAYEIPEASRVARGQAIVNFLELSAKEEVKALVVLKENLKSRKKGEQKTNNAATEENYLVMMTKNGIIKKTAIEDFANVRRSGLIAIKLTKGDELRWVKPSSGTNEIILVTAKGQSIHFKEKDARPMGRPAGGVRGIRLKKNDEIVGMDVIKSSKLKAPRPRPGSAEGGQSSKLDEKSERKELLVVMANGYGKKTDLKQFKVQRRGGSGIKAAQVTAKTGQIVAAKILELGEEELIAISKKGQVIRTSLGSISSLGRATQGVRIMKLEEGDKVASVTCL